MLKKVCSSSKLIWIILPKYEHLFTILYEIEQPKQFLWIFLLAFMLKRAQLYYIVVFS